MKLTSKITGEVIDINSPDEAVAAWRYVSSMIKDYEALKDKMKSYVAEIVDDRGLFESGGYQFRVNAIQRYNYDKSIMREVLDPDLFDTLLIPDKTAIDKYLKENVNNTGEVGTRLVKNMVAVGRPYSVIRLEKL